MAVNGFWERIERRGLEGGVPVNDELGVGLVLNGRYVLVEPLGTGGTARVFRGHDRLLGRDVAVKLLQPDLAADRAVRQRFRQEAQRAAALSHPNIVAVHD